MKIFIKYKINNLNNLHFIIDEIKLKIRIN